MEQFLYFLLKKVIFQPYNGGFSCFCYKFVVSNLNKLENDDAL